MAKKEKSEAILDIIRVEQGQIELCLLGTTSKFYNKLSEKAKRELLLPRGRLSAAQKAINLKHDPITEFRNSVHRMQGFGVNHDPKSDYLLGIPAPAFKNAMMTAALDLPSTKKAQIARLVRVHGYTIPVAGIPKISLDGVRSADINRTPDIRSRAVLPEWACRVTISFIKPLITGQAVANLMAVAGMTIGVGDWRQEKGSGDHGLWTVVSEDDPDFVRVMTTGTRQAQEDALAVPVPLNVETADLLAWYTEELQQRQLRGVGPGSGRKTRRNAGATAVADIDDNDSDDEDDD